MKYRAKEYFTDLQDNNYAYNIGDAFPRRGFEVSKHRIDELAGCANKQHRPVIELVEDLKPHIYTAKELESKTIAQIEKLASKLGYSITKTLKADIIEEFMSQQ